MLNGKNGVSKDFFRDNLIKLIGKTDKKPIVLCGRYNHNEFFKHYSFRNVRPWLGTGVETYQICNHLNVMIENTNCCLSAEDHGKLFFLIGFPDTYKYRGMKRGYLRLVNWKKLPQMFSEDELGKFGEKALAESFKLEKYKKISKT